MVPESIQLMNSLNFQRTIRLEMQLMIEPIARLMMDLKDQLKVLMTMHSAKNMKMSLKAEPMK